MKNFDHIDTSIQVGTDRKGRAVFDGDRVLSFNLMAAGEKFPKNPTDKIGVECTLRRIGNKTYVVKDDDSWAGCTPDDKRYGVEKI